MAGSSWRLPLLASCALPPACIPSNVVAEEQRAVAVPTSALTWSEPLPATLSGLYESVLIAGDIAQAMWKVYYHFSPDGDFSGAALVVIDGKPQFQTLTGRYRIGDASIQLGDDNEAATLAAARDHIRLTSAEGSIVLRRVAE
ncbi:MAG: hypothetical protein R3F56_03755 [Planctomycetota bacterium]